jgi:type I restriction enzyme S subunit
MTYVQTPLKRLLTRNDGGVWGDDPDGPDGPDATIVLRSTEQTVDGHWTIDDPAPRKLSQTDAVRYRLHCGDLLVTKSSGSASHIGKATLVTQEVASLRPCYSNFMQRLRISATDNAKFYWYVLRTKETREQMGLYSTTSTGLANLNATTLGELRVPRPPLHTQLRVVEFLDLETAQIDGLIGKQERLIGLLAEKRQAIITHAVTKGLAPDVSTKPSGVPWQGSVPQHWSVQPLKNLMRMQTGVTLGKDFARDATETYAYLRVANVQIGYVDLNDVKEIDLPPEVAASSMLQSGDVLMTEGGDRDKLARGCIWDGSISPCVHQNHIFAVRTAPRLLSSFLVLVLDADPARTYFYLTGRQSTNLASTNSTTVKNFRFGLPPVSEQSRIVEYLSVKTRQIDDLVDKARAVAAVLRERRSALISAAVTGKINIKEGVA